MSKHVLGPAFEGEAPESFCTDAHKTTASTIHAGSASSAMTYFAHDDVCVGEPAAVVRERRIRGGGAARHGSSTQGFNLAPY